MKPKSKFLLNPEHRNFVPRKSKLKFEVLDGGDDWGCGCSSMMLLFFIPASLMLPLVFLFGIWSYWSFEVSGVDVIATVTECQMQEHGENYFEPAIVYTYMLDDETYKNRHTVLWRAVNCGDFPVGSNLEAQYLLDDPSQSRITDADAKATLFWRVFQYGGLICGAIMMIGFTIYGISGVIKYIMARRSYPLLRKKGILLEGEIVNAEHQKRGEYENFHFVKITYEFETPDGRILTRSLSRRREDLKDKELPAVGTPITVLYADDYAVIVL